MTCVEEGQIHCAYRGKGKFEPTAAAFEESVQRLCSFFSPFNFASSRFSVNVQFEVSTMSKCVFYSASVIVCCFIIIKFIDV